MAIDTKSLTQIISDFRKLQSKDSITPESLGSILQRIADLLATAGTSDTVEKIQKLLDGFKTAGYAISSIAQGQTDRNHVYADIRKVSLIDGSITSSSGIFIQQATTERAGAMRAQQVTDLNAARKNVTELQKQYSELEKILADMQKALGIGDGSSITNVINTSQFSIVIEDGRLLMYGIGKLTSAGYVPYLFRHTRKRNQFDDKLASAEDRASKKYCPSRKGWNLYGSCHTLKISGNVVMISTNEKFSFSKPAEEYTESPSAFVKTFTRKDGVPCFAWGRSVVSLRDANSKKPNQLRMIRLRFGIGFAKKINPGRTLITTANLVTSLAEFSLIFNPKTQKWTFGK